MTFWPIALFFLFLLAFCAGSREVEKARARSAQHTQHKKVFVSGRHIEIEPLEQFRIEVVPLNCEICEWQINKGECTHRRPVEWEPTVSRLFETTLLEGLLLRGITR